MATQRKEQTKLTEGDKFGVVERLFVVVTAVVDEVVLGSVVVEKVEVPLAVVAPVVVVDEVFVDVFSDDEVVEEGFVRLVEDLVVVGFVVVFDESVVVVIVGEADVVVEEHVPIPAVT